MLPSSAEYWHMGEMTTRFGSVIPPTSIGVNSSGRGKLDAPLGEFPSQFPCKHDGPGLIAVEAERVRRDRHALSGKAGDEAALDHAERLLDRLLRVLDHAARLVARRERAVVGVAAVGEHFGDGLHAFLLDDLHHR